MIKPIVWTIAGSDPSGGAGIQADLNTFRILRVHACAVIAAITAQNNRSVSDIFFVPTETIKAQLASLKTELPPQVIKVGMIGDINTLQCLKEFLIKSPCQVVFDPVLISSSGSALFNSDLNEYCAMLKTLLPLVTVLTPNIPEAEILLQRKINTYSEIKAAANELLALGAKSVLLKGGHLAENQFVHDFWTNGEDEFWLANLRQPNRNYRGTGCALASAIAANLALGQTISDALVLAKMVVSRGIRLAELTQHDAAFLHFDEWHAEEIDLPYLSAEPLTQLPIPFETCGSELLGLYPIVENVAWIKRFLPLGIRSLQLRIKNKNTLDLEREIQESVAISKEYGARLFVNDYWELAIKYGAYGVHLGQEDLATADIHALRKAGVRVGISTHCYSEIARAHAYRPSYIACGPVYHTNSKSMVCRPVGLQRLNHWATMLTLPVVAIGGIDLDNMLDVYHTGVQGIALISALTQAENPEETVFKMLNLLGSIRELNDRHC